MVERYRPIRRRGSPTGDAVLRMVSQGLRNAVVAQRLQLSPRTVDHHVAAIMRKLNGRTRGEAVAAAARLGLTSRAG